MKILRLNAENIKRLSAVEITPDGSPVIVIGGENEAGKSSVLDAIEMALGGEKRLPAEPIRRGAKSARVIADLGDFVVTRRFTASGTSLTVTNREGAKYPSPQALLDGLVGRLTFDPMAFAAMKSDVQAATLRALAKIDTTKIDADRKAAYDERTLINRDITQTQALLATAPNHPECGIEPEKADALTAELDTADELASKAAAADRNVAVLAARVQAAGDRAREARHLIESLQEQLAKAEAAEEEAALAATLAEDAHAAAVTAAKRAAAAVPDRAALRAQVAAIDARNQKVAENRQRARLETALTDRQASAENLTARILQLDERKADLLASATFPIAGLGLDDQGVTWNGLPLSQASTSVRTRVSVAIGLALNPTLKVLLVRNGNDLGEKNLKLLADLAAEAGAQVWLERIAGGNGLPTVVIEDGTVLGQAVRA
jgi:hypothetical protein